MKNPEKYLLDIIHRHQPKKLKGQSARIIKLESELQTWAADCFMGIRDSGSHARGTATSVSSNVKLLLLLSNACHRNAGGIRSSYESLHGYLIERYRDVKKHRVSLRLRLNGMDIDITPARMQLGDDDLHTLYQPDGEKILETSVLQHAGDALAAARAAETKLIKIWFDQHGIQWPAIYVDYLVPTKLLANIKPEKDSLSLNFMHMIRQLAKRDFNPLLENFEDPANHENLLSELMSDQDKRAAIKAAQQALVARTLEGVIAVN
jgi:hypothetical protein